MIKTILLSLFLVFFLISCNKNETVKIEEKKAEEIKKEENKVTETTKQEQKQDVAGSKNIDEEFFSIKINFAETAKVNEELSFEILTQPKKNHHINTDYPLSLKLEKSCFDFKEKYTKEEFSKVDENNLNFNAKVKCAEKGEHNIKGVFSFGHCTDEICSTEKISVNFKINLE